MFVWYSVVLCCMPENEKTFRGDISIYTCMHYIMLHIVYLKLVTWKDIAYVCKFHKMWIYGWALLSSARFRDLAEQHSTEKRPYPSADMPPVCSTCLRHAPYPKPLRSHAIDLTTKLCRLNPGPPDRVSDTLRTAPRLVTNAMPCSELQRGTHSDSDCKQTTQLTMLQIRSPEEYKTLFKWVLLFRKFIL